MGEQSNKFKKGLNQDIHPAEQMEQTYRSATNFTLLSEQGNIYALTNEDGTVVIPEVTFPPGKKPIGHSVLNNDIIVILCDENDNSQVGWIREDSSDLHPVYGYYHPAAPIDPNFDPDTDDPLDVWPEDNKEFGFKLTHPVDCVSRKLINGSRVLYYTDNLNPFGRVELEDAPEVGNVAEQARLIFNQQIPTINFKEMRENVAGSLRPGVYQFITRYVTENGGRTTFGIPTDQISVVPTTKDNGVDAYHGEFYNNEQVNKNIVLELTGVDQNYQELEIVACYYEGGTTFNARVVATIPITNDTVEYIFTGPETGEEIAITREELRQVPVSYKRAKCIEQKDNTLFLSNLSDNDIDSDALQQVANNMTVSYQINEILYSGRDGTPITNNQGGFEPVTIRIQSNNQIVVTFSSPVAEIDSFNENSFNDHNLIGFTQVRYGGLDQTLLKNGEPARGEIDHAATAVGDTVEIDGITFTAVALGGITDPASEFEVDGVNNTASNLAIAINTNLLLNYSATLIDNGGIKTYVVWNGIGGEGVAINYTGGITGDATLTGEDTTLSLYYATDMERTGFNQITWTFDGVGQISELDEVNFAEIIGIFGSNQTSVTGSPALETEETEPTATDAVAKGFTDHIDEKIGYDTRSYRRGEVYSLGFMLLFKDGSTSFVYHIPGNDKSVSTVGKHYPDLGGATYRTGNTTGELGTFVSQATYPRDQNYPGDGSVPGDDNIASNRSTRHHVMPTLEQEPHFRSGVGVSVVRTLGLKFEIDPAFDIPAGLKEDVAEIIFVRERRNLDLNKSVVAQGLVNRLVETADNCDSYGRMQGNDQDGVKGHYCLQEMPFFNNLESMTVLGDSAFKSSGHSYRGVCWPQNNGNPENSWSQNNNPSFPAPHTFSNGQKINTSIRGNRGFFHCPESILAADTGISVDELNTGVLKPWLKLTGTGYATRAAGCVYEGGAGTDVCTGFGYQDIHGDYNGYDPSYEYEEAYNRVIVGIENRPAGEQRNKAIEPDSGVPNKTTTRWTQGGWEVKVFNPASGQPNDPDQVEHWFIDGGGQKLYVNHDVYSWDKNEICLDNCKNSTQGGFVKVVGTNQRMRPGDTMTIANHLYNLEKDNPNQYGQLTQATYIPCGRSELIPAGDTYETYFSGDTFITKFSFNTAGLVFYHPYDRLRGASTNSPSATTSRRNYGHVTNGNQGQDPLKAEGYDMRACHYYFVESDINTYYRHRPADEERQDYFPHEDDPQAQLDNFFGWAGNIRAYNGLYSFENALKEYFTKGSTQQEVTKFENRTIYSEKALTDTVVDSYRSFLVNSYYDLPAHTGPIWDTFIFGNTLYMHTPKSCWRTFAEPAATLSGGNISDVVLGTGALFARPSSEVMTTDGGYGGTISQFGGVHTHMGYMFPDVLQGKIFLLGMSKNGPVMNDLSLQGLYTFFHEKIPEGLIKVGGKFDLSNINNDGAHLIDNPYNGIGFMGGYDYKSRRAWIVKQGDEGWTLSYSALMQSWSSFHDYAKDNAPDIIVPMDNRVFFFKFINGEETVHEMNIGPKGTYFGTTFDSKLEMSVPTGEAMSFTNQLIHSNSLSNGQKQKEDFFKTVQVTSDHQNTTEQAFVSGNSFAPAKQVNETFYKFRNDRYQVSIPRDAVVYNNQDIYDLNNIWQPYGGTVAIDDPSVTEDYIIRERIKGEYAVFNYTYDNTPNNVFVLREIRTIFERNIR